MDEVLHVSANSKTRMLNGRLWTLALITEVKPASFSRKPEVKAGLLPLNLILQGLRSSLPYVYLNLGLVKVTNRFPSSWSGLT